MINTTVKTGSNIAAVFSASAFALAATAPAPRADDHPDYEVLRGHNDEYSTFAFVAGLEAENATDPYFVLRPEHSERAQIPWKMNPNISIPTLSQYGIIDANVKVTPRFNVVSSIKDQVNIGWRPHVTRAKEFFDALPSDQKTELVEEIIALVFFTGKIKPVVERVDDIITIDISDKGRSLGVMVEDSVCAISSFTRTKELKGTFFVSEKAGLDDFKDVLRHELLLFAA
ncbi:hypothetical protein [Agrobacterium tumefaciens]|uniref:hypothetical protein n=1 Tax=Agrobacterium tumefaciens TaxID=358 RepID=UPI000DD349A8|nr:hypothetical protein [Agrobacterium tumefaciens]